MRPLPALLGVLTAGTLAATLLTAPASAAPPTHLVPAKLPRGADVTIPHLDGKTIVDGTVRIRVSAPTVVLLGTSGTSYVVGTADRAGAHGRFFRIAPDGTRTPLGRGEVYLTELSGDSQNLVSARIHGRTTKVKVWSATTGATVATRTFRGYSTVLDADGTRVLVGGEHRTRLWHTGTGVVGVVSRTAGYAADLSADVFAAYTGDPYRDGCSVVRRISTGDLLWRSCRERVQGFNADGSRMATGDLLSDGIGPGYVAMRAITGHKLGSYTVNKGWFGAITFETPAALLLEANGARKTAMVRCTDAGCERASALRATVSPRTSGGPVV